jgi:hypothetical protein
LFVDKVVEWSGLVGEDSGHGTGNSPTGRAPRQAGGPLPYRASMAARTGRRRAFHPARLHQRLVART